MIVIWKRDQPEPLGTPRKRIRSHEIYRYLVKNYLSLFVINSLSKYTEYFGIEFNTIIIILMGDTNKIATWVRVFFGKQKVSIMNVSHMVRGLSESFGVVAKRRVVAKIKNLENSAAGKTANMILVSTVIYALVVALIFMFGGYQFAKIYTRVPVLRDHLEKMMNWYCAISFGDSLMFLFSTIIKIMGKSILYHINCVVCHCVIFDSLTALFLIVLRVDPYGVMYAFCIATVLWIIINFTLIWTFDWKQVKLFNE